MEKIGTFGFPSKSYKKKKEQRVETEKHVEGSSFSDLLESEHTEQTDVKSFSPYLDHTPIEKLLDAVHESGEQLKEKPTLQTIKEYRNAVTEFIRYIVTNSIEVKTEAGSRFNPLKRQKKYAIIKVINKELDKLAAGVIQNQYEQLKILGAVERINGLLVDLRN